MLLNSNVVCLSAKVANSLNVMSIILPASLFDVF